MKKLLKKLQSHLFPATIQEKPITVVVASYNNKEWYKKNLISIFSQKYKNYKIIYIDDCSTDGTAALVEAYTEQEGQSHRLTLIKNRENQGAMANKYKGSHLSEDNSIVVLVDGDDWLATEKALLHINKAYSTSDCWMTYGQFKRYPSGQKGHCKKLSQKENFRELKQAYVSHLRTYYAWLFKLVKKEDLMRNGKFVSLSEDVVGSLPMLEMARGHIKVISKIRIIIIACPLFQIFSIVI